MTVHHSVKRHGLRFDCRARGSVETPADLAEEECQVRIYSIKSYSIKSSPKKLENTTNNCDAHLESCLKGPQN